MQKPTECPWCGQNITALEAQVAAADRLAEAARVIDGDMQGFNVSWVSLNALRDALAAYRAAKGE